MAIKVFHPKEEFVDKRGGITRIIDDEATLFRAVLRITSKKGTIRSNHYHKKDFHYLYIESGKCEYAERSVDKPNAKIEKIILNPGDVVLSKPRVIHAVKFLEDTVLWAFTTEKRQHEQYEKDTKRVTILE